MAQTKQEDAFKNLVNLLSIFAEATARMKTLESALQEGYVDLVDANKAEYAELQKTLTESQAAIEAIARSHPAWFEDSKTLKTPYGQIQLRKTTKLIVSSEEVSMALIGEVIPQEEQDQYVRTFKELNLEALEGLDDATLERLKIKRETSQSFSLKPKTVDMGKTVKEAASEAA